MSQKFVLISTLVATAVSICLGLLGKQFGFSSSEGSMMAMMGLAIIIGGAILTPLLRRGTFPVVFIGFVIFLMGATISLV